MRPAAVPKLPTDDHHWSEPGTGSGTGSEGGGDGAGSRTAWSPLRNGTFRALFIATTVSNMGAWMQDVGRAWLMTELSPSPMWVALVQTAGMAALLLFSLPAGAAADAGHRRRVLVIAQAAMLLASASMGALTLTGRMTPVSLLALTFLSAAAAAFNGPAWQAALPSLVGRAQLPAAVTLNGLSFNAARALGPALGGVVVAASGPAAVFLLNAASFVGVIVALAMWREAPAAPRAAPEPLRFALRTGMRYAVRAASLRGVLIRTALFAAPASALWALLPVVARLRGGSAGDYGTLLAMVGAGAVGMAFALPPLRKRVGDQWLMQLAGLILATGLACATAPSPLVRGAAMVAAGAGWLTALTLLTLACQMASPDWIRGRAMSILLLAFAAAMTVGSAVWGAVAEAAGPVAATRIAAAVQIVAALAALIWRSDQEEQADGESRDRNWPEPDVATEIDPARGPVMVQVEYTVAAERRQECVGALVALGRHRRAEGSIRWSLHEHGRDPNRLVETNELATWGEHLLQRDRGSRAGGELEDVVKACLQAGTEPTVSHWFGATPQHHRPHDGTALQRLLGRV